MNSAVHPILLTLAAKLMKAYANASIRGEYAASFVFVQEGSRSVEISMRDEVHIWVEFWDHTLGEDSPPTKENTYSSPDPILNDVIEWLRPPSSSGGAG